MTKKQENIKTIALEKGFKVYTHANRIIIVADAGDITVVADGNRHSCSFTPSHIYWNSEISYKKALELVAA